jgi:hypothetical protein
LVIQKFKRIEFNLKSYYKYGVLKYLNIIEGDQFVTVCFKTLATGVDGSTYPLFFDSSSLVLVAIFIIPPIALPTSTAGIGSGVSFDYI